MPRRYRPPTRRRKSKRDSVRQETAEPAVGGAAFASTVPRPSSPGTEIPHERASQVRHIARDHRYVLGEMRLIALLTAFIVAGLVITAILR